MSAFPESGRSIPKNRVKIKGRFRLNTVEKLCFKMSGDFICDLSGITYCSYEGVADVA